MTKKVIARINQEIEDLVDVQRGKAKVYFGADKLRYVAFCSLMGDLSRLEEPIKKLVIDGLQTQIDYVDKFVNSIE